MFFMLITKRYEQSTLALLSLLMLIYDICKNPYFALRKAFIGESLELPKRLHCGYARMISDFEQIFVGLFSSVQKGQYSPM